VKKETFNLFYWFLPVAILIILDGMITTPIALYLIDGAQESNQCHAQVYDKIGIIYFFIQPPFAILIIYLVFVGFEQKLCKKKKLPLKVGLILFSLIELFAVTNNLLVLFKGYSIV